jgi:hypothetical protein
MEPKQLSAIAGVILVLSGLVFMAAQFIWPPNFANLVKDYTGSGWSLNTNVPGFGVIVVGAILLIAVSRGNSATSK